MKISSLILMSVLLVNILSQTISIVSFLKTYKTAQPILKLPLHCQNVDQNNICTQCSQNYKLQNNRCVLQVIKQAPLGQDFAPTDSFVPCANQSSCGQAKSFKSDQEFQDFVNKYNPVPAQIPQSPLTNQSITPKIIPQTLPVIKPAISTSTIFKGTSLNVQGLLAENSVTFNAAPSIKSFAFAPSISDSASGSGTAIPSTQFFSGASADSFSGFSSGLAPEISAKFLSPTPPVDPSRDFSGTNNQVVNVDEADLLKTDGTYIYTVSNQVLSIILAYPSQKVSVVSKINMKGFTPSALFIQRDYLAVFGTSWGTFSYAYKTQYTYIKIYDCSNRAQPFLLKEFQVGGSYFNGRKLDDGFMYLITNHDFSLIRRPWFNIGAGRFDLPFNSIFWYPGTYSRATSVNIISFNLGNPIASTKKIISICAQATNIMYMSQKYIYLTTSSWENGEQVARIRKIFVWGNYIKPFADGKVRGVINNQFSIDEFGQFLRVATTTGSGTSSSANLFVLNYFLNPYGNLSGIAPGQRVFSARFVGKRCYLVTFRQIDPFFVISLTNHKKPVILGQLKVPGFSRYLHPYDQQTIIGLGRNADTNGQQKGLKLAIFDVSDATNPKQSSNFQIEQKYAYSNAQWEHKAFLFSANKNLLVIPGDMNYKDTKFNGAFAFYISKTQIALKSVIDHLLNPSDDFNNRKVQRSLFIENLLYTKSKCLIRINQISDRFQGVTNVNIPCDARQFDPIIIPPIPRVPLPFPRPTPILDPVPLPKINPIILPIKPIPIVDPIVPIRPPTKYMYNLSVQEP